MPKVINWPLTALTYTLLTGIISFSIAAVSWRWFESPILSLRRHFQPQPKANSIARDASANSAGG